MVKLLLQITQPVGESVLSLVPGNFSALRDPPILHWGLFSLFSVPTLGTQRCSLGVHRLNETPRTSSLSL